MEKHQEINNNSNSEDQQENYASGGIIAELGPISKNIMGTTSFDLRVPGMRKAQDFIVYPIDKDSKDKKITIQSDTRIGVINLETGHGIMSQSHSGGAYFQHLSLDKKTFFALSPIDLQTLKMQIYTTAGSKVGESGIKSDNEGATRIIAEGGKMDDYTKNLGLVKVIFDNPKYNYSTNVSGDTTEEQARDYFVGKLFNVATYPNEKMAKVIDIEFHPKGTYGREMAKGGKVAKDLIGKKATITKWDYSTKTGKVKDVREQEMNIDLGRGVAGKGKTFYATIIDEEGNEHEGTIKMAEGGNVRLPKDLSQKVFDTKARIITDMGNLVNDVAKIDVHKATQIRKAQQNLANEMPDYSSGGTIRKVKVKIPSEKYPVYMTVVKDLGSSVIAEDEDHERMEFDKKDIIKEFDVDSRIIMKDGGEIKEGKTYPHSGGIARVIRIYEEDGKTLVDYQFTNGLITKKETQTMNGFLNTIENMETGGNISSSNDNFTVKEEETNNTYGKQLTYVMDLGQVDVGNNHLQSHLMKALSERPDAEEIYDAIGNMLADANIKIVYSDKYGNKYHDTFVVDEFPRHLIYQYAKGGQIKMKHPKDHYRDMEYNGYIWEGFWNGKHHFVKKVDEGYAEIKATDEDLENGNIEFMAEHNLSNERRLELGGILLAGLLGAAIGGAAGYGYRDSISSARERAVDRAIKSKQAAKDKYERQIQKLKDTKEGLKSKAISGIQKLEKGGYMASGGNISAEKKKLQGEIKILQDAIDNSLLDDETKAKIPAKIEAKKNRIAEIEEEETAQARKEEAEKAERSQIEKEKKLRTQSSKNKNIYIDIDKRLKEKMRNAIHSEGIPYQSKTEGDVFRIFLSNQYQLDIVTRLYNEKREKLGMEPVEKMAVADIVKKRVGKLKFMPVKVKPNVKEKLPVEKKRPIKKAEKKRIEAKNKLESEDEE